MKILFVLVVILVLLVLFPLATIWSLNTLFPALAIPVTLDTWNGNLDFVVARAIKMAEPAGIKIINSITIPNRTRFNIFVSGNDTIDLIR